jgi:hypothetical protein
MSNTKRLTAALAATIVLAGCAGNQPKPAETPTEFKITGTVTVDAGDASDGTMGGDCLTEGGYSDIATGAQVTVKDETGKVIALGSLEAGRTSDVQTLPKFNPETAIIEDVPQATKCVFGFTVPSVPEGESFYSIEVAHRGELRYDRSNLATSLALSLG